MVIHCKRENQRTLMMNNLREAINNEFFNELEIDAAMRLLTIMEKRDWINKKTVLQKQKAALSAYKIRKKKLN
jgi:hypothetical protein